MGVLSPPGPPPPPFCTGLSGASLFAYIGLLCALTGVLVVDPTTPRCSDGGFGKSPTLPRGDCARIMGRGIPAARESDGGVGVRALYSFEGKKMTESHGILGAFSDG